jgi:hypothetical protein
MRRTHQSLIKSLVVLLLAACTLAPLAVRAQAPPTAVAEPDVFQRLKSLQGEWVAVDENGKPTDQVVSVFRVTSGGHAIREVMFPGTANEMINMYYRDGDTVQMTHFCAAGNQPRMLLSFAGQPTILRLQFIDITNLASPGDEHMHEAVFTWVNNDRLKTEWRAFRNGRYAESSKFDLQRRR